VLCAERRGAACLLLGEVARETSIMDISGDLGLGMSVLHSD